MEEEEEITKLIQENEFLIVQEEVAENVIAQDVLIFPEEVQDGAVEDVLIQTDQQEVAIVPKVTRQVDVDIMADGVLFPEEVQHGAVEDVLIHTDEQKSIFQVLNKEDTNEQEVATVPKVSRQARRVDDQVLLDVEITMESKKDSTHDDSLKSPLIESKSRLFSDVSVPERTTYTSLKGGKNSPEIVRKSDMKAFETTPSEKLRFEIAGQFLEVLAERAQTIVHAFEDDDQKLSTNDLKTLLEQLKEADLEEIQIALKNVRDMGEGKLFPHAKPATFSFSDIFYRNKADGKLYLHGISGYVKPGQMMVMLGAPDSQMNTLLRVLAKRFVPGEVEGKLLLDRKPVDENFRKIVSYVAKYEIFRPTMTVLETLLSSYRLRVNSDVKNEAVLILALIVLKTFGLFGVRNEQVGDAVDRGISGGERRRLSFCQEIGGFTSVLLADMPTNGLDSGTAFKLCQTIRRTADALRYNCIFSLSQPSDDILNLFDSLMLLSKGHQIYFGPIRRSSARDDIDFALFHFESLGYIKPKLKGKSDFYQEMTEDPSRFYDPTKDTRDREAENYQSKPGTWQDLAEAWKKSKLNEQLGNSMWREFAPEASEFDFQKKQPNQGASWGMQLKTLLWRQWFTTLRAKQFSFGRFFVAPIRGLIFGYFYHNPGDDLSGMQQLFSFYYIALYIIGSEALVFLPFITTLWNVHVFQTNSLYYTPFLFYISFIAVEAFWSFLDILLTIVFWYWLVDMRSTEFSSYFWYFLGMYFFMHQFNRALITTLLTLSRSPVIAHIVWPFLVSVVLFTSGFLITRREVENVWEGAYWVNPNSYAYRGILINEFYGRTFKDNDGSIIDGADALKRYDLEVSEESEKYWMFGVVLAFWFGMQLIAGYATCVFARENFQPTPPLEHKGDSRRRGKRKTFWERLFGSKDPWLFDEEMEDPAEYSTFDSDIHMYRKNYTLVWKDVSYDVETKGHDGTMDFKKILKKVYGYAEPGSMTALMGATGAGKSTLLDVLADYKNYPGQTISGKILVNGRERPEMFAYISGYVEQFGSHEESMTIREAIEFSAALRLPTTVLEDEKKHRVEEVLTRLRLWSVANDVIGNDFEGGISPEYRKMTSIGVELVTHPGILFLDEPTTGLDSNSALRVMQTVKALSQTMCVLCTIHQPSKEVFLLFDSLILLAVDGHVVYTGSSNDLEAHFASIGYPEWDGHQNRAEYAIDCANHKKGKDAAKAFKKSSLYKNTVMKKIKFMQNADNNQEIEIDMENRPSWYEQCRQNLYRYARRDYIVKSKETLILLLFFLLSGILPGWVFYQPELTQSGVISILSATWITLVMVGYTAIMWNPILIAQRPYLYREKKSRMYSKSAYAVARWIVQFPVLLFGGFLVTIPSYYLVGMRCAFWRLYFAFLLTYLVQLSVVEMFSAFFSNETSAKRAFNQYNGIFVIAGGFFLAYDDMPPLYYPCYWLSPVHYGWNLVVEDEFRNVGEIKLDPDSINFYSSGADVIDFYDSDQMGAGEYIVILIAMVLVYKLLYLWALNRVEHIRR